MRKSDPSKICSNFIQEIERLKAFLDETYELYNTSNRKDKHQSEICELAFYRAYVEFESFLSDYFIAAINRKHGKFYATAQTKVKQSIESKFGTFLKDKLKFESVKNLTLLQVETLIDSDGKNLTFKTSEEIENRAIDYLENPFANRVKSVDSCTLVIIDAARSIRNCIAHKSKSSFGEMNTQLKNLDQSVCSNQLNTKINSTRNIGAYLKIKISSGKRIDEYFKAFIGYANHLK